MPIVIIDMAYTVLVRELLSRHRFTRYVQAIVTITVFEMILVEFMIDRNGNVVLSLACTDENSTILYMSRSSQRGYTYLGSTGYYSIELEDGSEIFIVIDDDSCTYNVITVP